MPIPSNRAWKRISRVVKDAERESPATRERRPKYPVGVTSARIREGFLLADLGASHNNGADEETAGLLLNKGTGDNWEPSAEEITVTNRDDEFRARSGAQLLVARINGEWRPIPHVHSAVFKLSERLIWGETADAVRQVWSGSDWGDDPDAATETVEAKFQYGYYFSGMIVQAQRITGSAAWDVTTPGFSSVRGVLDGALASNGSATVSVWKQTSGTWADTTDNLTGVEAWTESLNETIASGTVVLCEQLTAGIWHAKIEKCAP